jgi:hypothetical protein
MSISSLGGRSAVLVELYRSIHQKMALRAWAHVAN